MAFAVEDYYDLLRLLSEHPEWQADLRRAILPDDFRSLPDAVRELTEAQRRAEAATARFERRAEERSSRLEEALARLAEAQQRTEERVGRLEEAMAGLAQAQARMEPMLARAVGRTLEWEYQDKATGYFATMLRRPRAVSRVDLYDMTEGPLTDAEQRDVVMVDLVVSGRLRGKGETPEVLLAVEVSTTLDEGDVNRAARRAFLLRKAGRSAIPVVAGEGVTQNARIEAEARRVAIMQDGSLDLWDEALAAWPPLP